MSRWNSWCDCFLGFDPFKWFYFIGFTMSIFSFILSIIDLAYYVYYLSGAIPGTTASAYFLYLAVTVYIGHSIKSCCLCCIECDDNPKKDLDTYNLLAFLAIIFALIDGFLKYTISLRTSMIFFAYTTLGTYFLILTCKSKQEVSESKTITRQAEVETVTISPINLDRASRFTVPVQVERMEMRTSN